MRKVVLAACLFLGATVPGWAQEPCQFGSPDAFDDTAKALSEAKSCDAAAELLHACAWGSSADTRLAPIVITKCEKAFFDKLSPAAKKHYAEEMQLCAYEYAQQDGTMYMSAAAICQADIAARFAADPALANQPPARASFNCDRARASLEVAICSDVSLGHADIVLSRVYSGLLKRSEGQDRAALIQSEKQWLRNVLPKCGGSVPPFSQKSLQCMRNEFESRFSALDSCQEDISECLRNMDVQAVSAPPAPTPRASFDCAKPSTALEIVICADAELGQMDIKLAQAYRDARTTIASEQGEDLIESERNWLRFVSGTCPLGAVGGIPSIIARSCVRTSFQVRITQLQTCPQREAQQRMPCLNDFRVLNEEQGVQR